MHGPRSLSLLLPLFVAPVVGCSAGVDKDDTDLDGQDTDVVDTDTEDTDTVDTDVADTDGGDTDVQDTDVASVCGDGTPAADEPCFDAPVGFDGEGSIGAIAIADWDGGGADVIYGVYGSVYTLGGDGTGAFPSGRQIAGQSMGNPVTELRVGQLNSDSNVDVVVGGVGSSGRAIFGDGAGAITYETYLGGEGNVARVHVADIVGSASSDDVLLGETDGCGVLNMTSGTADSSYRADYEYLCSPTVGVIARTSPTHSGAVTAEGTALTVRLLTATTTDLTVGEGTPFTLPTGAVDMEAGDLDGDGDDEVLILLDDGTLKVMFSDGADQWEAFGQDPWVSVPVSGDPTDMALGDLDGDGDLDLAIAATTDDAVDVLVNDGTGSFLSDPIDLGTGALPGRITTGDLNADGVDDIAVGTELGGEIVVLISNP